MGLLSRLGGMMGRRGGAMADDGAGALRTRFGLSDTTPPDIAQRIGAFRSADARGMGGGMGGGAAQFHMQKEMLAQQLSGGDPRIMQMIRAARDPMDLEDIVGRLQNPASFGQGAGIGGSTVRQQGADFGMRPPQDDWGR